MPGEIEMQRQSEMPGPAWLAEFQLIQGFSQIWSQTDAEDMGDLRYFMMSCLDENAIFHLSDYLLSCLRCPMASQSFTLLEALGP